MQMNGNLVALIDAFDAVLNAGQSEVALSLFTDDVEVYTPIGNFHGKAEAAQFVHGLLAQHFRVEAGQRRVEGSRVTWPALVYLDAWRAIGVSPAEGNAEVLVDGGRIKTFRYTLTPKTAAQVTAAAAAPMGPAEVRALYDRYVADALNAHSAEAAERFYAEDLVTHNLPHGLPPGREGLIMYVGMLGPAFPDYRFTITDTVVEGEKLVACYTFSGTHHGEFNGIPATGRSFSVDGVAVYRIREGKIKEFWSLTDYLGLMKQLGHGLIPE